MADDEVLVNTKALLACVVEDLHLLCTSFVEMIKVFNRKSNRVPEMTGFLKATSLPYIFRFAPGARQIMAPIVEPLLRRALEMVLIEDSGGFSKHISAIEVPASWKAHFPQRFLTMHTAAANPIQELLSSQHDGKPASVDHIVEICFGEVRDILVVSPQDLWTASGMRLPGIVVFSDGLAMPCQGNHSGWSAEDCVESFVGEHTDVRLVQNYWFNHSLLDATRIKSVAQPLAARIELGLEDLREAASLFRYLVLLLARFRIDCAGIGREPLAHESEALVQNDGPGPVQDLGCARVPILSRRNRLSRRGDRQFFRRVRPRRRRIHFVGRIPPRCCRLVQAQSEGQLCTAAWRGRRCAPCNASRIVIPNASQHRLWDVME